MADAPTPIEYFESRGFKLRVEERDLHAEHMTRGEPGRASFFVEGRRYYVVDLLADDGTTLQQGCGVGETADGALESARQRFASEQG